MCVWVGGLSYHFHCWRRLGLRVLLVVFFDLDGDELVWIQLNDAFIEVVLSKGVFDLGGWVGGWLCR